VASPRQDAWSWAEVHVTEYGPHCPVGAGYQNSSFDVSGVVRTGPTAVTWPYVVFVLVAGSDVEMPVKLTWLKELKNSARNCSCTRS
jgi:hypothetical protein